MKRLTIIAGVDGRYSFDMDNFGATGYGATGVTFDAIEKVVAGMAPTSNAFATTQAADMQAAASRQAQGGIFGKSATAPVDRELRLECVRLAIMAGVPHDRVMGWASGLEGHLTRQSA